MFLTAIDISESDSVGDRILALFEECGCLSKLGRPAKMPILRKHLTLLAFRPGESGTSIRARGSGPGLVWARNTGRGRVHPSWPMMPITHMCAILVCSLVKSSLESVEWSVYRCPLPKRLLSNFVL